MLQMEAGTPSTGRRQEDGLLTPQAQRQDGFVRLPAALPLGLLPRGEVWWGGMLRAKLHQNVPLSFIFTRALSSIWPWEGSLSPPHLLLQVDTYQRPPIQGSCPPWAGGGRRVEGEDGNRSGPPSPLMSQPPQLSSWVSNLAKNFMLHRQSRQGWCAKPQKDQHSTFSEL